MIIQIKTLHTWIGMARVLHRYYAFGWITRDTGLV